jgi:hypothetical protein
LHRIVAGLTQKGYIAAASGNVDLLIMFGSGRREATIHEGTAALATEWVPDDEDADFVEGSLVIDAFDGATGGKVWHGAARAEIDPDHIDDAPLQRSVAKLLTSFPRAAR